MQLFPQEQCRSEGNCRTSGIRAGRVTMDPAVGGPLQKAVKIIQSQDQVAGDSCFLARPRNLEFDLSRKNGVGREQEKGF